VPTAACRRSWGLRRSSTPKIDPGFTFDRLAEAVNPFRAREAVDRAQMRRGPFAARRRRANVDRSIALETHELDVSDERQARFRNETSISRSVPKVRQGIPIEIPQIAELVRFTGSFSAPTVSVDAMASATAIARIGAAIGTGGLSVLGETLLSKAGASGAGACDRRVGQGTACRIRRRVGLRQIRHRVESDRRHRQRAEGALPAMNGRRLTPVNAGSRVAA
jgi:hypothetical protein